MTSKIDWLTLIREANDPAPIELSEDEIHVLLEYVEYRQKLEEIARIKIAHKAIKRTVPATLKSYVGAKEKDNIHHTMNHAAKHIAFVPIVTGGIGMINPLAGALAQAAFDTYHGGKAAGVAHNKLAHIRDILRMAHHITKNNKKK